MLNPRALRAPFSAAWQHRVDLLITLVSRDIKVRYKGSVLGLAWALVSPVTQLFVFGFLFQRVVPLEIPHYRSYLFSGVLAWNWFSSSVHGAASSLVDGRGLMRRPGFPATVLPVTIVTTNLVHYLIVLPVLFGCMLIDGIELTPSLALLPILLSIQFALTVSIGYIVALGHAVLRDTQHILGLAITLLFYLTPVFYSPSAVPAQYAWIYQLNPMVHLLNAYRALLLRGEPPALAHLGIALFLSAGLLLITHRLVIRWSHHLVEEL